jgi:hypothetical protein
MRLQVTRQVAHWRAAVIGPQDLENFASASAWRSLERYLDVVLRQHLQEAANRLMRETDVLVAELRAATTERDLERLRLRVIAFRGRYLQVETALEFYGQAINSRTTPRLADLLSACDTLARLSIEQVLAPLHRDVPPVVTYVEGGIGAKILRAGLRLWDGGSLSPAAAIKITYQNLHTPTALIHETGHQVAHIVGWNEELAALLERELANASSELRQPGPRGRRRSRRTRMRSPIPATAPSLPSTTSSREDTPSSGTFQGIRIRSPTCGCCSARRCAFASSVPDRGTISHAPGCAPIR